MGARQHRKIRMVVGQLSQRCRQRTHARQQDALACVPEHERIGEIVDVFGRAGEMQKRLEPDRLARDALELRAQEVFDGFDVVIRFALDRLGLLRILDAEVIDELVEHVVDGAIERRKFLDAAFVGEELQPADLDERSVADQRGFREVLAQRCRFGSVAAVQRRKGGERGSLHGSARYLYTSNGGVRIIHAFTAKLRSCRPAGPVLARLRMASREHL